MPSLAHHHGGVRQVPLDPIGEHVEGVRDRRTLLEVERDRALPDRPPDVTVTAEFDTHGRPFDEGIQERFPATCAPGAGPQERIHTPGPGPDRSSGPIDSAPSPGRTSPRDEYRRTMNVELRCFGPVREAVGAKTAERELPEGATVGDLLATLVADAPELEGQLRDESGEVAESINVTVEGRNVRQLAGVETTLSDGDVVRIAPPVVGGDGSRRGRAGRR